MASHGLRSRGFAAGEFGSSRSACRRDSASDADVGSLPRAQERQIRSLAGLGNWRQRRRPATGSRVADLPLVGSKAADPLTLPPTPSPSTTMATTTAIRVS
ncbi:hypothetical protein E2562_033741 [Oryza meyeriana var. granulata]|uniref:Uncharacterized protein n=1 Tax=Oryza meyeriana var. granulata TaxID=110450 RepID=A0A6G1E5X8_9ORYZ|nr:hypothetical protein E2562_033741 [Oryza meyeriana var. granulata]